MAHPLRILKITLARTLCALFTCSKPVGWPSLFWMALSQTLQFRSPKHVRLLNHDFLVWFFQLLCIIYSMQILTGKPKNRNQSVEGEYSICVSMLLLNLSSSIFVFRIVSKPLCKVMQTDAVEKESQ